MGVREGLFDRQNSPVFGLSNYENRRSWGRMKPYLTAPKIDPDLNHSILLKVCSRISCNITRNFISAACNFLLYARQMRVNGVYCTRVKRV